MKLIDNRKFIFASVVASIISATTFVYIFLYNGIHYFNDEEIYPTVSEYQVFEMVDGKKISVSFETEGNYIQKINVLLINLNAEESGELFVSLFNEKGNVVSSDSTPLRDIPAGEFYSFGVHKRVARNETYYIELFQTGATLAPYLLYCDENQVANGMKQLVDVTYMNEPSNWVKTGIMLIVIVGLISAVKF